MPGLHTLAVLARDTLYGYKARPLSRALRKEWAAIPGWYVKRRRLRYREAMDVARALAYQLREQGTVFPPQEYRLNEPFDQYLRHQYSKALRAKCRTVDRREREPFTQKKRMTDMKRRRLMLAVRALAEGFCPVCGRDFPDEDEADCHGFRKHVGKFCR